MSARAARVSGAGRDEQQKLAAVIRGLQTRFPHSSLGWAVAGDRELRLAYDLRAAQPFSARRHFLIALKQYREAVARDRDPTLAAGLARAYEGLGQTTLAVRNQRTAVAGRATVAPLAAFLVEDLERDHRFADAARAASQLAAQPQFPRQGLVSESGVEGDSAWFDEDALGPLSKGIDRMWHVSLYLGVGNGGAGNPEQDLSFIPRYRDQAGVTGYQRWCPGWSAARDLILAGQARSAVPRLAAEMDDIRPGYGSQCSEDTPLLTGVAKLEAGDRAGAIAAAKLKTDADDDATLGRIDDARQNLWRFGDNLARAGKAATDWRRTAPEDALAEDRSARSSSLPTTTTRRPAISTAPSARRGRPPGLSRPRKRRRCSSAAWHSTVPVTVPLRCACSTTPTRPRQAPRAWRITST